ncbi:MAG: hypothetical protein RIR69_886, partial [Actinomycetota bacterium]
AIAMGEFGAPTAVVMPTSDTASNGAIRRRVRENNDMG